MPFKNKDQIKDKHEKPYELEGVSKKTSNIVMKCLDKDRRKRFQAMEEVLKAFETVEKEEKEKFPKGKWILFITTVLVFVLIMLWLFIPRMPDDVEFVKSKGIKVYKNDKGIWEADYGESIIMAYIPKGTFTMGSNDYDDEKPPHEIYLDSYWMGKYEVTVKQFGLFVKDAGYVTEAESSGGAIAWTDGKWDKRRDINWKNPGFTQEDSHPVVCVSWNDAIEYCKWLSVKKGVNFKLPTEAQWEKSARGTDRRKYPCGDTEPAGKKINFADKQAWLKAKISWAYKDIDDGYAYTAPVGSYPAGASPYGLLDMGGNVWEWCSDWYGSKYYKNAPKDNPTGPKSVTDRVLRGGCWYS